MSQSSDSTATPSSAPANPSPAPAVALPLPAISIDLGLDYLKLASLAFKSEDKYEVLAALNFRFGLSLDGEYGYVKKSPLNIYKNGDYSFEGSYFRVGLGYNVPIQQSTNMIGFGLRYGKSKFEDSTSLSVNSVFFEPYKYGTGHKNEEAQWVELVLKSEGELKKVRNVKLGMFIRMKFLDPVTKYEDFPILGIPGYGIAKTKYTAAVNLYIKYSIPLFR